MGSSVLSYVVVDREAHTHETGDSPDDSTASTFDVDRRSFIAGAIGAPMGAKGGMAVRTDGQLATHLPNRLRITKEDAADGVARYEITVTVTWRPPTASRAGEPTRSMATLRPAVSAPTAGATRCGTPGKSPSFPWTARRRSIGTAGK